MRGLLRSATRGVRPYHTRTSAELHRWGWLEWLVTASFWSKINHHVFRFPHTPPSTILALPSGVFHPSFPLGATSQVRSRESRCYRPARCPQYVLDPHGLELRASYEGLYALRSSSPSHAPLAAVVRRGCRRPLDSGIAAAAVLGRRSSTPSAIRAAVKGQPPLGSSPQ